MQQRLAIAQALLNDPETVILDETSQGPDTTGMVEVRDLVKGMAREGMTIYMSSHLLNEVEQVCGHATMRQRRHQANRLQGNHGPWRLDTGNEHEGQWA